MTEKRRVAIVGAGASGLPSIRHAKLYGFDVVCFEATGHIGGLWKYKPEETEESSVMKSTIINTSKEMNAYSDFPPLPEMANFMHNTELYRYFELYSEHHSLNEHIRFHHRVRNIKRADDYAKTGKWDVTYTDADGKEHTEAFDGVLVCSGHHAVPYMPAKWPGQDSFKGIIKHSHSYKDQRGYDDKTIVCVGIGNSGGDIAVELSRCAKQVYLATRRGTWVFNRIFDYGEPVDLALNRRYLTYIQNNIPQCITDWAAEHKLNSRFDHATYGLKPPHSVFNAHPTVNDDLPNRIASGTIRIRPNLKKFTETGVEFEDGSKVDKVDAVILSTGYSFGFPIVEKGKLISVKNNEVELYKYMFPIETSDHNTLAVIGLIQPFGSILPISEMQARVFLDALAGNTKLPSKQDMQKDIDDKRKAMASRFVKSRRHTLQVDYVNFMDELSSLMGCCPDLKETFKSDPMLALKLLFGPNVPYCYRVRGPHTWPGAREAIMSLDKRVFRATNSGEYRPSYRLYIILAISTIILILIIM